MNVHARADEVNSSAIIADELVGFAEQLTLRLDVFSFESHGAANVFSQDDALGVVFDFDVKRRKAHLSLGAGNEAAFALRLDAKLTFDRGIPRVRARLDLGLIGHRITLRLPDIKIRPRSYRGEVYVEYSVPLLEGRF